MPHRTDRLSGTSSLFLIFTYNFALVRLWAFPNSDHFFSLVPELELTVDSSSWFLVCAVARVFTLCINSPDSRQVYWTNMPPRSDPSSLSHDSWGWNKVALRLGHQFQAPLYTGYTWPNKLLMNHSQDRLKAILSVHPHTVLVRIGKIQSLEQIAPSGIITEAIKLWLV